MSNNTAPPLDSENIKRHLLLILDRFIDFCNKNNLTYFMAFGSALGAVRHKGFIPWDDDIDITMPEGDYRYLIENWNDKEYPLFCLEKNTDYTTYYAKISDSKTVVKNIYMKDVNKMGIFIDIFPMYSVSLNDRQIAQIKNRLKQYTFMMKMCAMNKFWPSDNKAKSVVKYLLFKTAQKKDVRYWNKKIDAAIAEIKKTVTAGKDQYIYYTGTVMDKSYFGNGILLEFEGRKVKCPEQKDRYLTDTYGNYMQLPPKDKQITNHDFYAFEI